VGEDEKDPEHVPPTDYVRAVAERSARKMMETIDYRRLWVCNSFV